MSPLGAAHNQVTIFSLRNNFFFAIFILKCAKVVVSSVWLVIANWFVIVYRVDGRGRLFFSRLILSVIFAVNRWVRLHFLSVV